MIAPNAPGSEVAVLISGGFALAYQAVLPKFVRATGIEVETLSGASQGEGPTSIRHQLEHGARVDVVILSNEGLHELTADDWIVEGSAVELATAPLAAAVRAGSPRPEIRPVDAFKRSLLEARLIVMPGSTSGLFIQNEVFPRLGVSEAVRTKVVPRGTDSAAALVAGEADLALGPVSELVHIPQIELVGTLPDEVQLVQTFSAAIVREARNPANAERLIAFLASDRTAGVIERTGMVPVGRRPGGADA